MTIIEIESSRLKKIIKYADLITGSDKSDPGMKLYFSEGLKIYATDGGISTHFKVNIESDDFSNIYDLHIPTLKLFLDKGFDDIPVYIKLNETEAVFKFENEILSLFQPSGSVIPEIPVFKTTGTVFFQEFINGINFASIIMPENDYIYFFVRDGILFVITIHNDFFTLYNSNTMFENMEIKIPYHNIRHFVKALSLIKNKDLKIGINLEETKVAFQTSGILTHICTELNSNEESLYLLEILNLYDDLKPIGVVDFKTFKAILAKISRISKNGNIELEIKNDDLIMSVKKKNLYYSSTEKMKEILSENIENTVYSIHPGKIKSAIAKIEDDDIYIYSHHDFLCFGNSSKTKVLALKGKILERGW